MQLEIKVPSVGESINEVTLAKWLKTDGAIVQQDELICELESEKATFELAAEKSGLLKIVAEEGATLAIGDLVCRIDTDVEVEEKTVVAAETEEKKEPAMEKSSPNPADQDSYVKNIPSPAAEKMMRETAVEVEQGTGKNGRITKSDVIMAIRNGQPEQKKLFTREERRVTLSTLRKTISKHLVAAKNTTAMLTTFNEVDMKPIMDIRARYKDAFKEKHGVGLGFMSFFAKAACFALQEWPSVNAFMDGDELIYHDYCDISIAVSTPKGLVVPVIRNAESLSFAEMESRVADLAKRGRENKLSLEEMSGGTFTITNGGVFGSLMSTPIINIPQAAILGMHKIQERPVVIDGQIVIRPMMYLALSYDHRTIDGRESVSFLVRVKELLEKPELLLMGNDPVKVMLQL